MVVAEDDPGGSLQQSLAFRRDRRGLAQKDTARLTSQSDRRTVPNQRLKAMAQLGVAVVQKYQIRYKTAAAPILVSLNKILR
jgi:hypothetical protein